MTLGLTEARILAAMASRPRGVYCVTTAPGRKRGAQRVGVRELHALESPCRRGLAEEIARDSDQGHVRGPTSRVGGFVTVTAQITPEGRAAHRTMARQ